MKRKLTLLLSRLSSISSGYTAKTFDISRAFGRVIFFSYRCIMLFKLLQIVVDELQKIIDSQTGHPHTEFRQNVRNAIFYLRQVMRYM